MLFLSCSRILLFPLLSSLHSPNKIVLDPSCTWIRCTRVSSWYSNGPFNSDLVETFKTNAFNASFNVFILDPVIGPFGTCNWSLLVFMGWSTSLAIRWFSFSRDKRLWLGSPISSLIRPPCWWRCSRIGLKTCAASSLYDANLVIMQPTIKIVIWSWKAKIDLIGVWHNENLPQGTNTIGMSRMTPRNQLIFDKSDSVRSRIEECNNHSHTLKLKKSEVKFINGWQNLGYMCLNSF